MGGKKSEAWEVEAACLKEEEDAPDDDAAAADDVGREDSLEDCSRESFTEVGSMFR